MYAVIFEVEPNDGCRDEYLDIAASLRPMLDEIDGFISIERFQSLSNPGKVLSLSFWRDEEAIAQWRTVAEHRAAQTAGRGHVFRGYRLRIAETVRDYGMFKREEVPEDSRVVHGQTLAFRGRGCNNCFDVAYLEPSCADVETSVIV